MSHRVLERANYFVTSMRHSKFRDKIKIYTSIIKRHILTSFHKEISEQAKIQDPP